MEIINSKRPHIVILQSPGMGHLIPLVELTHRLALHHNFSTTLLISTLDSPPKPQHESLQNLPPNANYVVLPPISSQDIPAGTTSGESMLSLTILLSLPSIRQELKPLAESNLLAAFIVDTFGTDAFDVAEEFNVPCYVFFLSNAMTMSLFWRLPELDRTVQCDLRDLDEPLRLPGCAPVQGRDLMAPIQERKNDGYKWMLHHAKRYRLAQGIMINSFKDLEPEAIKALQEPGKPPIYPIGPLIRTRSVDGCECLRWLDRQPHRSVLYISFGSGGTLNQDQLTELALGLELSHQRFLWVVKSPHNIPSAAYFTSQSQIDPLAFLPNGFLGRTKDMGLVVPSWAPQVQVLSHRSTGGFLTHCGWNSILESIVHGIPFIVWPLFAEQKMNSILLSEDLKIALRPKANENGIVDREEVAKIARELMSGEEEINPIRKRIREFQNYATEALGEDGDSMKAISDLACMFASHKKI